MSVVLRWGLKLCIYNRPPADAHTANPRSTLSNNAQGMIFIIILYNFYNLNSFSAQPALNFKTLSIYGWETEAQWCLDYTVWYFVSLCQVIIIGGGSGENVIKSNGLIDCWEHCLNPFSVCLLPKGEKKLVEMLYFKVSSLWRTFSS